MENTSIIFWKKIFYAVFVVFIAGVSASVGAVAGGVAVFSATQRVQENAIPASAPQVTVQPAATTTNQVLVNDIQTAVTQAVETVGPAVVTVVGTIPGVNTFFGRTSDSESSGSGVIISENGYIITNNHVIEGTTNVRVILADGEERAVEVINTDKYADLAVLKAEGPMPAVAALGNSDQLRAGETVIAIGSPLGEFKNTVTVGVVSATGRSLETNDGFIMEDLVQTDAAINQGNSGGPLVNLAGQVIGINTLIVRNGGSTVAEGLGFAIPANTVSIISEQIIQQGYFARPYLGVNWQSISPYIARRYNLPVEYGAYVTRVDPNGPAGKAGIETGDIIIQIGDKPITANYAYINALYAFQPGEEIIIRLYRENQELAFTIVLGEANQ